MAKYKQSFTREYVDCETGEIKSIETQKVFTSRVKTDSFYMTFIDYMSPIFKITKQSVKDLLLWMCKNADYNSGKIVLSSETRKQICKELDITNSTISNSIKILKELKLIEGKGGTFQINPQIFWKGELAERDKMLSNEEIQITFSIGTPQ